MSSTPGEHSCQNVLTAWYILILGFLSRFVQTEMGNASARLVGLEKAFIGVDESCDGMVRVIDAATKESHGGRLWDNEGTLMRW